MLDNGDSTLIVTPQNKTILIDGGGKENYDIGEKILIPFILNKGIMKIDFVIISHFDSDHVGGLLTILEKIRVGKVIIPKQTQDSENYKKFREMVKEKKFKVICIGTDESLIEFEKTNNGIRRLKIENDLYFDFLWPNTDKIITENLLNNNSIVCKLNYKQVSILFTGDIEEIAENEILKQYKNNLQVLNSVVLKVGHHGSKTSSTSNFIEAVKPKIALIGVGENNKFGHPSDEVIDRLSYFGSKIYRTDQMGEIIININCEGKLKLKKFINNI